MGVFGRALSCVLLWYILPDQNQDPYQPQRMLLLKRQIKIPGRTKQMRMITTEGEILLELFEDEAPETVANFKQYAAAL